MTPAAPRLASRTWAWLAVLPAVLLALPAAAAANQPSSTLPAGVLDVSHSAIAPGQDFQVTVQVEEGAADRATVTVCRFEAVDAPAPELCYMNLGAAFAGTAFLADTSAVDHPAWHAGWVVGYKVTLAGGPAGTLHAPNSTVGGEPDYYRHVVGAAEGTAVVEDGGAGPGPVASGAERGAPLPPLPAVVALALALLARRAR